jgi:hypothetical protein
LKGCIPWCSHSYQKNPDSKFALECRNRHGVGDPAGASAGDSNGDGDGDSNGDGDSDSDSDMYGAGGYV